MNVLPASPVISGWWIFCVAVSGWYVGALLIIWLRTRDIVAMLYLMMSLPLLVIFSFNVIIRSSSAFLHADDLVAVQRAMYAPLLLALGALIDIYAAEHNGHLGLMPKLMRRFTRKSHGHTTTE